MILLYCYNCNYTMSEMTCSISSSTCLLQTLVSLPVVKVIFITQIVIDFVLLLLEYMLKPSYGQKHYKTKTQKIKYYSFWTNKNVKLQLLSNIHNV
jgi:hypothetical protein